MRVTWLLGWMIGLLMGLAACSHNTRELSLDEKFSEARKLAGAREQSLFNIFDESLTPTETQYLKYIYAHMPLSDLADYDGDFYLNHVRTVLKAKQTMSWAASIPEDIFLSFVLPPRVNNENLDSARIVFYHELKDRIKGMSMEQAALEINHWSHEKVEYRPSDGRTSSPLATVRTAHGRCGEQTTFSVTALRSVALPARQVYTPRWAHADDNHAWVEVWIDGEWRFFGACEPEPVLDRGWFNEPASRAMLLHARVFGGAGEKADVNFSTSQYDDVNVTDRYAHTFRQAVKILDSDGMPANGATVEYQLYNYAEFYPLTKSTTNDQGLSFFTAGLGDLLVWAYDDKSYGFEKISVGEADTVTILLSSPAFADQQWVLSTPPPSEKTKSVVTEEQITQNKFALQYEDSLRNEYVSGFISEDEFKQRFPEALWKYVDASRGNFSEIMAFIDQNRDNPWVEDMLQVIAAKDLRDTKSEILNDHLRHAVAHAESHTAEIFTKYILNPRIELEMVLSYRAYFLGKFDESFKESVRLNPAHLMEWINANIHLKEDRQSYNLAITPRGVYDLRMADQRSRNVFFVAVCRSFGIPARLVTGTGVPQFMADSVWVDAHFDGPPQQVERHTVRFEVTDEGLGFSPQYYYHYSIAKFDGQRFNTFELADMEAIRHLEEGGNIEVTSGTYRLITSLRPSSDRVLVDQKYFQISQDTVIGLRFPRELSQLRVEGSLDRKILESYLGSQANRTSDIFVALIQPDKEPSKHILNDIQAVRESLEALENDLVFIIQRRDLPATFNPKDYPNLPKRTTFQIVEQDPAQLLNMQLRSRRGSSPEVMIVNPKGEIIYYSDGYRIGIGNDLLRACSLELDEG